VNTGAPLPGSDESLARAKERVLGIQAKLHRWAGEDPARRFDDLFNLVTDPAVLRVAWERVRTNRGARTAGVDGSTARYIRAVRGEDVFLADLRAGLRDGSFAPLPVRERMIPKSGGRLRRLGIPTVRDRVAQAALKLVPEPIFEADFHPCSYGFRPRRRAQDAIAEIHYLGSRSYEWVLEADIEACFDTIGHTVLMSRVRRRVGDKRVLRLVKAFLKSGLLTADGTELGTAPKPTNGRPCSASSPLTRPWPPPGPGRPSSPTGSTTARNSKLPSPLTLLRPARKGEPERPGAPLFKPLRQTIESINQTLKAQLDLERDGGHTRAGVTARVLQRILALTAAIWHNDHTGAPIHRSLTAYDD
jgi:retron-type reverse transcriptase